MPAITALGDVAVVAASFTRPADTTAYTAGDVVSTTAGAIITFANIARERIGAIQGAILMSSANVATKLDAELWLFTVAPAATADNAAIAFTDAELAKLVAVIPFSVNTWYVGLATSGAGGNAVNPQTGVGVPFNTNTGTVGSLTNDLYGVLVARNAYVPVSAEIFTVTLSVLY